MDWAENQAQELWDRLNEGEPARDSVAFLVAALRQVKADTIAECGKATPTLEALPPTTMDGVAIVLGRTYWTCARGDSGRLEVGQVTLCLGYRSDGGGFGVVDDTKTYARWYSTPAAALEAAMKKDGAT